MIENPNRRDVLTKGSALIVASGAVLSASPGKTQEESGFIRFDQARVLYPPHAGFPPFGLDMTVFPEIDPEELFGNSREVELRDMQEVDMTKFTSTYIVGHILQASSLGKDGNVGLILESIDPHDHFLEKSEELLHFFAVPPTGISLADNMEGARVRYVVIHYMDVYRRGISIENDRITIALSPVFERQCPFANFACDVEVLIRKFTKWVG